MTDDLAKIQRREFLARLTRAGGLTLVSGSSALLAACSRRVVTVPTRPNGATSNSVSGWNSVPSILARIKAPTIPRRDFDITRFGAIGDGKTDNSDAVSKALAACKSANGGRVVVPLGIFITGPIHLSSHTELHVSAGAVLRFVTDPSRYLPAVLTRFEGVECYNYSPFVYALDAVDVAITGTGALDGQASDQNWWSWKGTKDSKPGGQNFMAARAHLFQMAEDNVPVADRKMGSGSFLRPNFIQFYRCRNVLVEGVTVLRSPMWEIHPVLSQNVTIRNVNISSHGPNNDGCDPESCRDVLIEHCTFDTGDDCIAIKSGRNADGRRVGVATENVIVRDCIMKDGHGGVTIGSEISGNVRNVFVERCQMDSPNLDRALRLKTNAMRGGVLEHIYMRDVTVGTVADSVLSIDFSYEEGANGKFSPVVRDIELLRVTSTKSNYAAYLKGFSTAPIRDVRFISCSFNGVAKPDVVENAERFSRRDVRINGKLVIE